MFTFLLERIVRPYSASVSNKVTAVGRAAWIAGISLVLTLSVIAIWLLKGIAGDYDERTLTALDLRDDALYLKGSEELFNGLLVEDYNRDARKLEVRIEAGRAHGVSRGWYENGQMEVEEFFAKGVSDGVRTRWYQNGSKKSEAFVVDGVLKGSFKRWHENGTLAAEMEMKAGNINGIAEAWHPSGVLKSRVTFVDGVAVEKTFFPDTLPVAQVDQS